MQTLELLEKFIEEGDELSGLVEGEAFDSDAKVSAMLYSLRDSMDELVQKARRYYVKIKEMQNA